MSSVKDSQITSTDKAFDKGNYQNKQKSLKSRAKKLSNLKLNGKSEPYVRPFSDHFKKILGQNDLKILNPQKTLTVFKAVSEALFLSNEYSETLKKQCINFMEENFTKKFLPEKLSFLVKDDNFLQDYIENIDSETFTTVR